MITANERENQKSGNLEEACIQKESRYNSAVHHWRLFRTGHRRVGVAGGFILYCCGVILLGTLAIYSNAES